MVEEGNEAQEWDGHHSHKKPPARHEKWLASNISLPQNQNVAGLPKEYGNLTAQTGISLSSSSVLQFSWTNFLDPDR